MVNEVARQQTTETLQRLYDGKHKARMFATLGFTVENADELRAALVRAAGTADARTCP